MKKVFLVSFALLFSQSTLAALYFGRDESLHLVLDVEALGPNGEDLQLSRLVIRKNLLLPYTVSDGGLVFSIKGTRDFLFSSS